MSHEIPKHWRLKEQRLRLIGEICPTGHAVFPPRDICPDCHKEAKTPLEFSGKGVIESFTVMHDAPQGFEGNVPYVVALVRLDEGPMITAQLTDLETTHGEKTTKIDQIGGWPPMYDHVSTTDFTVEIGMPVEMVTRKLRDNNHDDTGIIQYGYKFRPLISSSSK